MPGMLPGSTVEVLQAESRRGGETVTKMAVVPAQAATENPLAARLALLEDLDAIRALNRAFARQESAGAPRNWGSTRPTEGWPFRNLVRMT